MHSLYPILLCCVVHNQMYENECLHQIIAEFSGKCIRSDRTGMDIKPNTTCSARSSYEVMSSCYWALPAQLHPWYKPPTLKRKPSAMLPRSESPFPVDEYDSDSRVKRQRHITLDQTRSKKRNLPSPPQSPIESDDQHLPKRQRCTTLERGLEGLSLTPPAPAAQQAPEFTSCLPAPVFAALAHPPDFSSRWPEMSLPTPCSRPIPSPSPSPSTSIPFTSASTTPMPPTPALTADLHAAPDVKMRTSSWYEPEKDRTCFLFSCSCCRWCRW
jgi:hypothetical protein